MPTKIHRLSVGIVLSLVCCAAVLAIAQTPTGTIRGTVFRGTTSEGIPQVDIVLSTAGTAGATGTPRHAVTDSAGRFEFSRLEPGTYTVQAQAQGYHAKGAGPGGITKAASGAATIRPQTLNPTVTLRLNKAGVIGGRIRDIDGQPAAGVKITPNRLEYRNGQPTLSTMQFTVLFAGSGGGSSQTDDRGEFRLYGLPDGEYYLSAESKSGSGRANVTYYPGVTDASRAVPVVIKDGNEVTTDFGVEAVRGFTVSGKILVPEEGKSARSISLFLKRRGALVVQDYPPAVRNRNPSRSADGSEYAFELEDVEPGTYDLFAIVTPPPAAGGGLGAALASRITFEVGNRNVEGLIRPASRGQAVTGRIVGDGLDPVLRIENTAVSLQPLESLPSLMIPGSPDYRRPAPDGSFVIENVFPGTYLARIGGSTGRSYAKDIRLGDRSVFPSGMINVGTEPVAPLEFKIATGLTTVQGVILDRQQPIPGAARVVLLPEPPARQNLAFYRWAESGPNGVFRIGVVPPGEYKIFAWDAALGEREQDTAFVAQIESLGQRITIHPAVLLRGINVQIIRFQQK